jgi:hypothetical protein
LPQVLRNRRAVPSVFLQAHCAQEVHVGPHAVHEVRVLRCGGRRGAGTSRAVRPHMAAKQDAWTLPLHVIEWTVIVVGLVMAMAVFLMH